MIDDVIPTFDIVRPSPDAQSSTCPYVDLYELVGSIIMISLIRFCASSDKTLVFHN